MVGAITHILSGTAKARRQVGGEHTEGQNMFLRR